MEVLDVLLDSVLDALKLLPWLLLLYIIIELLEHKTDLMGAHGKLNGKLGPLIGSATGLVPQCGFSVMAAKLFEQNFITVGTLLAIFLSTSDEAFVMLVSDTNGVRYLLPFIVVKIAVGVIVGYSADGIIRCFHKEKPESTTEVSVDAHDLFIKKEKTYDLLCNSLRKKYRGNIYVQCRPPLPHNSF